jgi:L-fuconolactonase
VAFDLAVFKGGSPLVDTHLHLWHRAPGRHLWIGDGSALDRDFDLPDVEAQLTASGVSSAVLVQADDTAEDLAFMLDRRAHSRVVDAVVGWLPLSSAEELERSLELLDHREGLRGVRRLPRRGPWHLDNHETVGVLAVLERRGLVFEIANPGPMTTPALESAARAHPELTIVIDHAGCPPVEGMTTEWATWMTQLARRPGIVAKVSAIAHRADLTPIWDALLDWFGPDRLMFGSDWPVSATGTFSYHEVVHPVLELIDALGEDERAAVRHGTAEAVYRLRARE